MKMTPIKKIILGIAAACIVISIITANNMASVMMLIASRNAEANIEPEYVVKEKIVTIDRSTGASSSGSSSSSSNSSSSSSNGSSSSSSNSSNSSSSSSNSSSSSSNNSGSASNSSGTGTGNAGGSTAATPGKKPETKAEVVEYFNKSVNGVKTNAKTVDQQSVTNYLAGATTISDGLSGIYGMSGGDEWLDGMLKDNSQGAASYSGGDITAKFPVEGEAWASQLTVDDVTEATCTESNGVYTIKIVTVADEKSDSVQHGQGHAPKAFNVILPSVVNDNIPGIATSLVGTAAMEYPSSTAIITVDAATGNVTHAEYDLKWTIHFDKMSTSLPFGSKAIYDIKY